MFVKMKKLTLSNTVNYVTDLLDHSFLRQCLFSVPGPDLVSHFTFSHRALSLETVTVPQSFLGFQDLATFKESWPGVLWRVPQAGAVCCFPMIRLGCGFGGRSHGGDVPFPSNPMAGSGHVRATSTSSSLVDANLCHLW